MGLNSHLSKLKSCRTVIELLSIAYQIIFAAQKKLAQILDCLTYLEYTSLNRMNFFINFIGVISRRKWYWYQIKTHIITSNLFYHSKATS